MLYSHKAFLFLFRAKRQRCERRASLQKGEFCVGAVPRFFRSPRDIRCVSLWEGKMSWQLNYIRFLATATFVLPHVVPALSIVVTFQLFGFRCAPNLPSNWRCPPLFLSRESWKFAAILRFPKDGFFNCVIGRSSPNSISPNGKVGPTFPSNEGTFSLDLLT